MRAILNGLIAFLAVAVIVTVFAAAYSAGQPALAKLLGDCLAGPLGWELRLPGRNVYAAADLTSYMIFVLGSIFFVVAVLATWADSGKKR